MESACRENGHLAISQYIGLFYRVAHVPAFSSTARSTVLSAVWSTTQVLEEAWLQWTGLPSPGLPWEAVIISERVHGRSHPQVIRTETPSLEGNHRLECLWSHDEVYSST